MKVGFMGLGLMGRGMAGRLLEAGHLTRASPSASNLPRARRRSSPLGPHTAASIRPGLVSRGEFVSAQEGVVAPVQEVHRVSFCP